MRFGLALVALLPLSACVVPPAPVGYGYGYPPPGYSQPGYAPAGYPAGEFAYSGYSYNDGSPTLYVEGSTLPLIFYGGAWGYWGREGGWHRAPEGIDRHLSQRFPGGAGYRPWAGGPAGRPEGFRPGGPAPGGFPAGGNGWTGRPAGPPPGGGTPWAGRPVAPAPGGGNPWAGGANPWAGRPGGPAPGGSPPGGARPFAPQHAVAPAAVSRPVAPAPERHRQDDHH